MPQTTITVQSNTPPEAGKKKNKIIDVSGDFYYVWPNKADNYQPGGTYDITFTQSTFNGNPIRNIESGRRSQAAPQTPAPRAQAASGGGGGGGAHDEHIHVSLILKEAIRANLLDPNNEDAVVELALKARSAHKRIWSAPAPQRQVAAQRQSSDDMEDGIPF